MPSQLEATAVPRVYLLSSNSVHAIRQSLQIILDFAELNDNPIVLEHVRCLIETFAQGQVISGCLH